jgi:ATP-dependent Clp protease ATP-binding subunit ClpA
MFDLGKEMVIQSGGKLSAIMDDLQQFFEERMPQQVTETPIDSLSFIHMLELAAAQSHAMGKQHVTLLELFVAIFFLKESFAHYFLTKNGVDRLELLKSINREKFFEVDKSPPNMPASQPATQAADKSTANLSAFTIDLCDLAQKGKLDPLVGRQDIITRTVQVLCRRLKNNPVHVGDPGVGKTAVVEGLAQRIVNGDVPEILKDAHILLLDMGALLAGTKYRGDFEERLVKLLDHVAHMKKPILYIDEIHTVVGAGAVSGGGMDATSIIKPYLSRGEIRFIGSTTYDEYKKHFEKDRALARRFQRIDVNEPTADECTDILKGLQSRYEDYHGVSYSDEVLTHIVEMSTKYMNDRYLPDKAIDVMDESGVMASLTDNADPAPVTRDIIERTVALMAKVPPESIAGDEKEALAQLEGRLNSVVYGQENAVTLISDAIKASRAGLNEPERPVANLLFVGPTGVGKTEVAKQLAMVLGIPLLRFDMSEYQEKHAVARLIGSPPGYVGYEEGGLLTDAVRKSPHAVLLLDEIEKSHEDILNILLQVMDYGTLTDNTGKKADFRNIVMIMTSNAGAREMNKQVIGFDGRPDSEAAGKAVERIFSPEFRNRLDAIVPFNPVDEAMARLIAQKAVRRLGDKLSKQNVKLTPTEQAIAHIASAGKSEQYGAREIIRMVENDVKKLLVQQLLFGKLVGGGKARLDYKKGAFVVR